MRHLPHDPDFAGAGGTPVAVDVIEGSAVNGLAQFASHLKPLDGYLVNVAGDVRVEYLRLGLALPGGDENRLRPYGDKV